MASFLASPLEPPRERHFAAYKRGHRAPTWKLRHFELRRGRLTYREKSDGAALSTVFLAGASQNLDAKKSSFGLGAPPGLVRWHLCTSREQRDRLFELKMHNEYALGAAADEAPQLQQYIHEHIGWADFEVAAAVASNEAEAEAEETSARAHTTADALRPRQSAAAAGPSSSHSEAEAPQSESVERRGPMTFSTNADWSDDEFASIAIDSDTPQQVSLDPAEQASMLSDLYKEVSEQSSRRASRITQRYSAAGYDVRALPAAIREESLRAVTEADAEQRAEMDVAEIDAAEMDAAVAAADAVARAVAAERRSLAEAASVSAAEAALKTATECVRPDTAEVESAATQSVVEVVAGGRVEEDESSDDGVPTTVPVQTDTIAAGAPESMRVHPDAAGLEGDEGASAVAQRSDESVRAEANGGQSDEAAVESPAEPSQAQTIAATTEERVRKGNSRVSIAERIASLQQQQPDHAGGPSTQGGIAAQRIAAFQSSVGRNSVVATPRVGILLPSGKDTLPDRKGNSARDLIKNAKRTTFARSEKI